MISMSVPSPLEQETYFSKPQHLFPHLEDGKIPTEQFLSACQGIADFVGFLGTAFSPVKADINGNVVKVRTRFEKDRIGQRYLQDLIDMDLREHGGNFGIATEGLLWLKRSVNSAFFFVILMAERFRGLEFMLELLTSMVQEYRSSPDKSKTENLVGVINKAYEKSLKRHHGFMSKQLFKLVIHAAPYRRTILKAVALGKDGLDDLCIEHIASHLDNFRINTILPSVQSSSVESSNLGLFFAQDS
ncbi:Glycolipid transfer protein [Trichostrongylus colubriformis]|uniref:Glycolipid transfer protein n=1 Tax=Trichostrongylus colubriformis TaxID=6319 RepID=A0AAN8EW32_TRICO